MSEKTNKAKSVVGGEAGTNGASSVHYDRPLSDYSVKVVQDDTTFKARQILSNFNSPQRQNLYYFYEPAYFMINQVKERAEGAEAARAKYGVSRKPFTTTVYALKEPVTDETVANADKPIDRVYEDAAKFVTRQFLLHKEIKMAEALLTDTAWATSWTGQAAALTDPNAVVEGGAFQKFTVSTSKPLDVLDAAMESIQLKSGLRPNTMVLTRTVWTALKRNSQIKTTKLYTNGNGGSDDAVMNTVAEHLGISPNRIFVLDTVTPSSAATIDSGTYKITTDTEGYASGTEDDDATTIANEFIGGKGILLMHVDLESTGQYSATAAVCAQWTGLYPDGGDLGNTVFKRYRKEEFSSEFIEGRTAFSYHIVAPALGLFLKDVV